jgi:hypothetical protein
MLGRIEGEGYNVGGFAHPVDVDWLRRAKRDRQKQLFLTERSEFLKRD